MARGGRKPGQPAADGEQVPAQRLALLYHFCRLQLPTLPMTADACQKHLRRTFDLFAGKAEGPVSWEKFLDNLYPLDWYVVCGCLDGDQRAWEYLFAVRTGRSDCLLLDALRARAARLYPRNEERQDSAVDEFWGHLYVPERPGSLAILARYDGQRPLAPWLIRVFQNWHISQLRQLSGIQALPDEELAQAIPLAADDHWRAVFTEATHVWLAGLEEQDLLLLGLRLRYRLSQREVAQVLHLHEGTVSRRTDHLRDRCLQLLEERLVQEGWTGDNMAEFIRTEMQNLLLDDPRLSADALAKVLGKSGA
jgi:RNA polymerase sigma factor (sigma-70 family)